MSVVTSTTYVGELQDILRMLDNGRAARSYRRFVGAAHGVGRNTTPGASNRYHLVERLRMRSVIRRVATVSTVGWLALTVPLHAQRPLFDVAAPIPIAGGTGGLTLTDTNGDGHLDLVVNRVQRGIEVRFGNGRGQFAQPPDGDAERARDRCGCQFFDRYLALIGYDFGPCVGLP